MCSGQPILCKSRISQDVYQWFIGCSMFNIGDRWHRYTKIDCESIDIILLRDLFLGKNEVTFNFTLLKFINNKYILTIKFNIIY